MKFKYPCILIYEHINGTLHRKHLFSTEDVEEVYRSPFVKKVRIIKRGVPL